jgi:hypothetical protein
LDSLCSTYNRTLTFENLRKAATRHGAQGADSVVLFGEAGGGGRGGSHVILQSPEDLGGAGGGGEGGGGREVGGDEGAGGLGRGEIQNITLFSNFYSIALLGNVLGHWLLVFKLCGGHPWVSV